MSSINKLSPTKKDYNLNVKISAKESKKHNNYANMMNNLSKEARKQSRNSEINGNSMRISESQSEGSKEQ